MAELREYSQQTSIVFRKTKEQWGGLSNMAGGYPLMVNGIRIPSSESLYQAMKFTGYPKVQEAILSQRSPMEGKRIARHYPELIRQDWEQRRVAIMKWVACIKLCQNWETFSRLLLLTANKHIVEYSRKDPFWGAKIVDTATYYGMNVLGRILMLLREISLSKGREGFRYIPPPNIAHFYLLEAPVQNIILPPGYDSPPQQPEQLALF